MTRKSLLTLLLLSAFVGLLRAKEQVETVFLFQNRAVVIAVPAGMGFATTKNDHGLVTVHIADPKEKFNLQITFLPDPEGRFNTPRSRKEMMNETFGHYVAGSVEKAMQFEELESRVGAGTYCVFTDANLVGKSTLPPGEHLNVTTGIKTWPGVAALFYFFSSDTHSKEYQAVMTMLRDSVYENPLAPAKPRSSTRG